ncbi:MAG: 50S ribosomal protein L30 [Bdellovibrionales bacterium]
MSEVIVTLKKSINGASKKQKASLSSLGLRKINRSRVFKDTSAFRGQLKVVGHLISVEKKSVKKKQA